MCALCTLAHSSLTAVLQLGGGKSNTCCSLSTTHKFMPFACVERAKPSDADDLQIDFDLDQSPQKINLAGEVYCNGGTQPYLFQAVRKAMLNVVCTSAAITNVPKQPLGNPRFTRAASELVLSKEAAALQENRVLGIQTRSSIEALRLAAQFLREKVNCTACMLARPGCEQYQKIFNSAGFRCFSYNYYNEDMGALNTYGLVADLITAPEFSVVLLDACTQNPTGLTPGIEEWKLIAHVMKCKKMIPLFHLESHGIASGDIALDTWPIRYFADCGFDFLVAQSFVQNFGLYYESVGHLMVVVNNTTQLETVRSQFERILLDHDKQCVSSIVSSVVAKVLTTKRLRKDWTRELQDVHHSMQQMRLALGNKLEILKTPGNWEHLKYQRGPHLYTNLKMPQLIQLRNRHVYVPNTGRINVGALRADNVSYVAEAINDVMSMVKKEDLPKPAGSIATSNALQAMQQLQLS